MAQVTLTFQVSIPVSDRHLHQDVDVFVVDVPTKAARAVASRVIRYVEKVAPKTLGLERLTMMASSERARRVLERDERDVGVVVRVSSREPKFSLSTTIRRPLWSIDTLRQAVHARLHDPVD